ncbi:MAG TPA: hypothetical protein VIM25_05245 [Candidatus Limnocylindrales bacterium]
MAITAGDGVIVAAGVEADGDAVAQAAAMRATVPASARIPLLPSHHWARVMTSAHPSDPPW